MKWETEEQSALLHITGFHRKAQHIGISAWAGNIIISYHSFLSWSRSRANTLSTSEYTNQLSCRHMTNMAAFWGKQTPNNHAGLWESFTFLHLFFSLLLKSLFLFHNLFPLIFLYHIQPKIAFSYTYFSSKLDLFSTTIEDVWICFCLNNCFFSS